RHSPIAQLKVDHIAFERVPRDCEDLLAQLIAGERNGRRGIDRAAACDSAVAHGDRCRIRNGDGHLIRRNTPCIGGNLGKYGLVPLALGTGSGRDIDRSRRINAHGCTLERTGARALDIAADTESDKATLAPRLVLLAPECSKTAEGIDGPT